jgi:two-component system LytT family response regulator
MGEKITAILIDDEANSRKVLGNLLNKFCPEVEVCGEAEDIEDAYSLIVSKKPDLVFLDIQMPNGNGFSLLKKFESLPFDVIFVTSFDEYAINAIKFSALDYLLKPVEVKDLVEAVQKAVFKKMAKLSSQVQIINLLSIAEANAIEKKIVVHQNDKVILLRVDEICRIEADNRYCHLNTIAKEKHTIAKTLKEFEEFFSDNPTFVRISKNIILNINYIKDYSKGEPCIVEMHDGSTFEISRRKKQEVLERLKKN